MNVSAPRELMHCPACEGVEMIPAGVTIDQETGQVSGYTNPLICSEEQCGAVVVDEHGVYQA